MSPDQDAPPGGLIAGIVRQFLNSKLSILFILFSICMGAAAIFMTPREEEPQIVVPLADVIVTPSPFNADQLSTIHAIPEERIRILPLAVRDGKLQIAVVDPFDIWVE